MYHGNGVKIPRTESAAPTIISTLSIEKSCPTISSPSSPSLDALVTRIPVARQGLKRAISSKYFTVGEVTNVVTVDPAIEQEIMNSVKNTEQGSYLSLDPERSKKIVEALGNELKKLEDMGKNPIVITSPIVRMYFRNLAKDYYKDIIVISYNEVESNVELQSVGMVTA